MNVFSAFDGMSCGQIALNRAGIKYKSYYASEIDKYSMQITKKNFPGTIHLGDIRNVNVDDLPKIDLLLGGSPCQSFSFAGKRNGMSTTCDIEILTLDQYLELKAENFEFEGQSYLFWEYIRVLELLRKKNPDIKFLLENVMMGSKWQKVLTRAIGINPICINSALVSAQNRERLYWTNIYSSPDGLFGDMFCKIPQPKDKGIFLESILQDEVDQKYFLSEKALIRIDKKQYSKPQINPEKTGTLDTKNNSGQLSVNSGTTLIANPSKSFCLDANYFKGTSLQNYLNKSRRQLVIHNMLPRSSKTGKGGTGPLSRNDGKTYCLATIPNTNVLEYADFKNNLIRRLTPVECERLQTVDDDYTSGVSETQMYKMLGNGWTIDVIVHILSYYNL